MNLNVLQTFCIFANKFIFLFSFLGTTGDLQLRSRVGLATYVTRIIFLLLSSKRENAIKIYRIMYGFEEEGFTDKSFEV